MGAAGMHARDFLSTGADQRIFTPAGHAIASCLRYGKAVLAQPALHKKVPIGCFATNRNMVLNQEQASQWRKRDLDQRGEKPDNSLSRRHRELDSQSDRAAGAFG